MDMRRVLLSSSLQDRDWDAMGSSLDPEVELHMTGDVGGEGHVERE